MKKWWKKRGFWSLFEKRWEELSKKKKGQAMDYLECLRVLRGDNLPEDRAQAVEHLFQAEKRSQISKEIQLKSIKHQLNIN